MPRKSWTKEYGDFPLIFPARKKTMLFAWYFDIFRQDAASGYICLWQVEFGVQERVIHVSTLCKSNCQSLTEMKVKIFIKYLIFEYAHLPSFVKEQDWFLIFLINDKRFLKINCLNGKRMTFVLVRLLLEFPSYSFYLICNLHVDRNQFYDFYVSGEIQFLLIQWHKVEGTSRYAYCSYSVVWF